SRAQTQAGYARAIERAASGDAALAAYRWLDARDGFEAARELFTQAAREAVDSQRAEVERLRAVAGEARSRAEAAGALDGAAAALAVEAARAAEQDFDAERYESAVLGFVDCAARYDRALIAATDAR